MKILSWNVGLTNEWFRYIFMGLNNNILGSCFDIGTKLLEIDSYEKIDIVFFQELNLGFDIILEILKNKYPFYIYKKKLGLAIFSKYNLEPLIIQNQKPDNLNYLLSVSNGYIICYVPEIKKYLCNIHFNTYLFNFNKTNKEIDILKSYIESRNLNENDFIYGGDLNMFGCKYEEFCRDMNTTINKSNKHKSYHYIYNINLDYLNIKTKDNHYELDTKIIKTYESDHFPIVSCF